MQTTIDKTSAGERLVEHVQDWRAGDVRCDAAARVVRNVALTGTLSRNGYRYTEQALRDAVPLYENRPVFLDRAANLARPFERSTRDLVGTIVRPRFEDGRIRGDIEVLPTEAGNTFLALAEGSQTAVGMSHVVLVDRGSDPAVVEKIRDVVSVDAVVFPATNATFSESQSGADIPVCQARPNDVEDLSTLAADRNVCPTDTDADLVAQVERLSIERDELRTQLSHYERERHVDDLLREAKLPPIAVSDVFRRTVLAAPDAATRQSLVADRVALWQRLSQVTPSSRERVASESTATDAAVIRAIKRPAMSVLAISPP